MNVYALFNHSFQQCKHIFSLMTIFSSTCLVCFGLIKDTIPCFTRHPPLIHYKKRFKTHNQHGFTRTQHAPCNINTLCLCNNNTSRDLFIIKCVYEPTHTYRKGIMPWKYFCIVSGWSCLFICVSANPSPVLGFDSNGPVTVFLDCIYAYCSTWSVSGLLEDVLKLFTSS